MNAGEGARGQQGTHPRYLSRVVPPTILDHVVGLAEPIVGLLARHLLPALNRRIDIQRIELDAITAPVGALGGQQGAATAQEWVQNDVVAFRAIEDYVRDQLNGLHSRMQVQIIAAAECVHAWIIPDIGPIAPKPTHLDVVQMRFFAVSKDEYEFVPRAVK